MNTARYGDRLEAAVARYGRLCVGIDPHPAILDHWGLPRTAAGVEQCARGVIEAVADRVALVKPQSAFFEAHGSAGIAALERVLADARDAGLITVLDVKRGDIGSTMAAYVQAYLADGAPLAADAITLSPYLGPGSLDAAINEAGQTGRGVYLLAATSNPEATSVQQAVSAGGSTISQSVVDAAVAYNLQQHSGDDDGDRRQWGSVGVVIGATIGAETATALDLSGFCGTILAPGLGAQGGTADDLRHLFRDRYSQVLPTSSRSIMAAGPDIAALRSMVAEAQSALD